MCLNSVFHLENYFCGDWGQQKFTENTKQQTQHEMLTSALLFLELL